MSDLNEILDLILTYRWWVILILAAILAFWALKVYGEEFLKSTVGKWANESGSHVSSLVDQVDLTHAYLQKASKVYARFKFRGLPSHIAKIGANRLSLDQAYVSVRVLSWPEKGSAAVEGAIRIGGKINKSESMDITETMVKLQSRRLAIIGVAGSGKSTLLQWAGLACARALLKEKLKPGQQGFVDTLGGKTPLPLLVPLRAYNEYCKKAEVSRTANSLLDFMASYFSENQTDCEFNAEFFKRSLRDSCLLMFDGMDEVEQVNRSDVRSAVENLLMDFDHPRLFSFIASRYSAAYVSDQMSGFQRCEVQRMTREQRNDLIRFWHTAVHVDNPEEGRQKSTGLITRLDTATQQVRDLATTPLMVTIFCMVSYSHELPRLRAKLYEDAIEVLLTDTVHHDDEFSKGLQEWGGMDWNTRRDHLALIAFKMQEKPVDKMPEDDLVELIWNKFGADQKPAEKSARNFIQIIAERGGLLEAVDDEYGFFTHATFQEYLSGRYLAEEFDTQEQERFLKEHFMNDQWQESIRLAVGYLSLGGTQRALRFVNLLSNLGDTPGAKAAASALAGECLSDMLPERREPQTVQNLTSDLREHLEFNPPHAPVHLRQRLGLALGSLGDPRFPVSYLNETKVVLPEMISIPAGVFRMGTGEDEEKKLKEQEAQSWDDEKPSHDVFLSDYSIGKYPVTNAEFRCFWERGGYDPNAAWWSEDGRKWRTGTWETDLSWLGDDEDLRKQYKDWLAQRPVEFSDRPFWWDDLRWNVSNLPVVGITWFEMEAYCSWLSHVTGRHFRLPTEAEWEHAARGDHNWIWAWGNTWDSERANTDEAEKKIAGTSPVGMYPHGASPYGVQDMNGNVWEWCMDRYNENEYQERSGKEVKDPCRMEGGMTRVVRGGSWSYYRRGARCSCRSRNGADDFNDNIGFRVVCSPLFETL